MRIGGLLCAMSVTCALAGCSSSPAASVASPSAMSSTPATPLSRTPSLAPTPPADGIAPGSSPLSGRPGGAGKPVLVVKVDNTVGAEPHAGLRSADIVYIEEVEGGLTRLAAVFSTELPSVVGPVRSARISDIDLVAQFDHPALAYSGVQARMIPILADAPLYEVSGDRDGRAFFTDRNRRAPTDFMGRPTELLARAPNAGKARDIGFRFDVRVPAGGKRARDVHAPYPASGARFVWDPRMSGYDVVLNGLPARAAEGGTQIASTVVIQYVKQYDSGFGDRYGGRTPKLTTIGRGNGIVLRNGRVWPVTWRRPAAERGTTFRGADGKILPFAPGAIWVALVNRNLSATVR